MAGGGVLFGWGTPAPQEDPDPAPLAWLTAGFSILESSRFLACVLPLASNCKFHRATALGSRKSAGKSYRGRERTGRNRLQTALIATFGKKKSLKVGFDLLFGDGRNELGDFVFKRKYDHYEMLEI